MTSVLRSLCQCSGWRCNIKLVPYWPASCRATVLRCRTVKSRSLSTAASCSSRQGTQHLQHRQQCCLQLSTTPRATGHDRGFDIAIDRRDDDDDDEDACSDSSSGSSSSSGATPVLVHMQPEKPLRVERLLANLGYGKRQECVVMLKRKRVVHAASGKPAKVGEKALAGELLLDGEPLDPPPPLSIILHKPVGYVVTSPDDENVLDPKVYDLLPYRFGRRRPFLSAIGRLDKETSGLLLLTDDGKLLHSIQSPARGIWKLYTAELGSPLVGKEAAAAVRKFASGRMVLQGDRSPLLPAGLHMLGDTTAEVAICEGRYHQIRRMFAAIGREVVALHRHAIGGLSLAEQELQGGGWRYASVQDLTAVLTGPDLQDSIIAEQQRQQPDFQDQLQRPQQQDVGSSSNSSSNSEQQDQQYKRASTAAAEQQPAAAAAAGDKPLATWYAPDSTSSDGHAVGSKRQQQLHRQQGEAVEHGEDDVEVLEQEEQAVKRYRSTSKWAKRRAAMARNVKALRWQKQQELVE